MESMLYFISFKFYSKLLTPFAFQIYIQSPENIVINFKLLFILGFKLTSLVFLAMEVISLCPLCMYSVCDINIIAGVVVKLECCYCFHNCSS